jgi:hypothetical protein
MTIYPTLCAKRATAMKQSVMNRVSRSNIIQHTLPPECSNCGERRACCGGLITLLGPIIYRR